MPLYLVCTGTVSKVEKKKMEKKQRKAQLKAQSKAMEEKKGSGPHGAQTSCRVRTFDVCS